MSKKRHNRISTTGSQISTIISVSLVLLIVGLILIISHLTAGASDSLRQQVAVVVKLDEAVSDADTQALKNQLQKMPYTASLKYTSAEDVLAEEMIYEAEVLEVLGQNPYTAEFEIHLRPQYVNTDSISLIERRLESLEAVNEVISQIDMIDSLNEVMRKATIILAVLGCILLVISVVLLFNTISLVIYSRRFIIRTMQLVGATRGFVRQPFVRAGLLIGIISALIASSMLLGLYIYSTNTEIETLITIDLQAIAIVCTVLFVLGALLCGWASWVATNRFLNAANERLYSR